MFSVMVTLNCVTSYHCYVLVCYYVRLTLIHFLTPASLSTLSWGKWLTASLLFNACVCPTLNIIVLHLISSSLLVCSVYILLVVFSVSLFLLLIRVIPYNKLYFILFCHFLIIVVSQLFLGYSQSISFYDKKLVSSCSQILFKFFNKLPKSRTAIRLFSTNLYSCFIVR